MTQTFWICLQVWRERNVRRVLKVKEGASGDLDNFKESVLGVYFLHNTKSS